MKNKVTIRFSFEVNNKDWFWTKSFYIKDSIEETIERYLDHRSFIFDLKPTTKPLQVPHIIIKTKIIE